MLEPQALVYTQKIVFNDDAHVLIRSVHRKLAFSRNVCDRVRLVEPEDGSAPSVEWAGDSRWMEVSIGLLGEEGSMRALGPTLHLPTQARGPNLIFPLLSQPASLLEHLPGMRLRSWWLHLPSQHAWL